MKDWRMYLIMAVLIFVTALFSYNAGYVNGSDYVLSQLTAMGIL